MKLKLWFTMLLVALAIGLGGQAFALHSGGVADCAACHSMHGSYGINAANATSGAPGSKSLNGAYLLTGSDQSSTCLNCHANNGSSGKPSGITIMTYPAPAAGSAPVQRSPGGDFGWLIANGTTPNASYPNYNRGHNIIASDYGLTNLTTYTTAPGSTGNGAFLSANLYCNACHDPHNKLRRDSTGAIDNMLTAAAGTILPIIGSGSYPTSVPGATGATVGITAPGTNQAVGVYRILAGYSSYKVNGQAPGYTGVPIAIAPSTYNQTESATQVRVAYGVGTGANQVTWGAWCGTCHTNFNTGGVGAHYHPVDGSAVLSGAEGTNYNNYVTSGNMNGSSTSAFLSLVPFMMGANQGSAAWPTLAGAADNTGTVAAALAGPGTSDQVSCLTCHRAHASGFQNGLRWNTLYQFITYQPTTGAAAWPGTDNGASGSANLGLTSAMQGAAYYDRAVAATGTVGSGTINFPAFQRSLCNKCHAQD